MNNRHVVAAVAGTAIASVALLALSSLGSATGMGESLVNHAIGLTIAAFLGVIGYEDWKDAQRDRLNKRHSMRHSDSATG